MADWFDRLFHAAQQAGQNPLIWQYAGRDQTPSTDAGGPRLLVLPKAGRIMACQMPGVSENLFFHHHMLEDAGQAGDVLATGGGIGGDRLWIAPETAFMWKNLADISHDLASHAHTPPAMDPAAYRVAFQSDTHLQLTTDMELEDDRSSQSLSLRVSRQFQQIDPPWQLPAELHAMSFAIRNDITLIQGGDQTHAGTWDLLQLPAGGTLICPTLLKAESVRSYYEPLDEHVRVTDDAVLFRIDSKKRCKLGLLPELTTGRMGYYKKETHSSSQSTSTKRTTSKLMSTLIVRSFLSCPGQTYIDLPVDEILQGKRQGGDALQAYNHNTSDMAFGEMEYHDPAVLAKNGPASSGGQCVTHVLAGPDELIRQEGKKLLGVALMEF